jgi:signal transduction histidine kinase
MLEGKLGRASLTADLQALEEGSELALRNLERVLQHIAAYQELNPGLLATPPRPVDLAELVRQAWQRAVPPASPLQLVMDAELTVEVCADSLQAVLVELLLNVQRHAYPPGSAGEVRVQARQDGALLRLTVADNGRGIAPELLTRVFDPYVSTQFGRGRSGLGLFSAQALVATRLRGELLASSPLGQGARFEISWPLPL